VPRGADRQGPYAPGIHLDADAAPSLRLRRSRVVIRSVFDKVLRAALKAVLKV